MDTSTNNYVTPSTHDVEANSTKLPWLVSQRETVTLLTKLSDADEDKANKTLETTSDQDVKNMLERTHTKLSRYDFTSCQGVSGHFFILVHFCFDLAESILFRGSATTVFFCGMILLMALIVPLMAHKKKVADKVMHSFRRSLNATHRERALMIRLLRLFGGKSWTMKYVISTFFFFDDEFHVLGFVVAGRHVNKRVKLGKERRDIFSGSRIFYRGCTHQSILHTRFLGDTFDHASCTNTLSCKNFPTRSERNF